MEHKFKLGQTVKDRITGFTGIAIGYLEYINGCIQYGVRPKVESDKVGKHPDAVYLDEGNLEYVDEGILATKAQAKPTGFDASPSPQNSLA